MSCCLPVSEWRKLCNVVGLAWAQARHGGKNTRRIDCSNPLKRTLVRPIGHKNTHTDLFAMNNSIDRRHSGPMSRLRWPLVALTAVCLWLLIAVIPLVAFAQSSTTSTQSGHELSAHVIKTFGEPPAVPTGPLSDELKNAVDTVFVDSIANGTWGRDQEIALETINESGDPRIVWVVSDLMRFLTQPALNQLMGESVTALLGITFEDGNYWGKTTDHLIAWDIPAPPDYLTYKRSLFTTFVPGWERIFVEGDIDWRHVSWGGVLIDNRPYDTTDELCNCIPAADNPPVSSAKDATWLKDDDIVFGVEVNGEFRAYPRRIMEVREMVNDTLGGRNLGIPYCTLCGAAQAYFTDVLPDGVERPVLRTSGLLIRSNKVMYDITSHSVLDTFRGNAVTGPLADIGFKLTQASVVTTEWGRWKEAHPETTVLIEDLALGRDFDFRNNRDADGPIFPVGDVDPRLSVHEDIVGVVNADGQAVAFQRSKAMSALIKGDEVAVGDIRLLSLIHI